MVLTFLMMIIYRDCYDITIIKKMPKRSDKEAIKIKGEKLIVLKIYYYVEWKENGKTTFTW